MKQDITKYQKLSDRDHILKRFQDIEYIRQKINSLKNLKSISTLSRTYKTIINFYADQSNIKFINLSEKIYFLLNNLEKRPLCRCGCNREVKFVSYKIGYNKYFSTECQLNEEKFKNCRKSKFTNTASKEERLKYFFKLKNVKQNNLILENFQIEELKNLLMMLTLKDINTTNINNILLFLERKEINIIEKFFKLRNLIDSNIVNSKEYYCLKYGEEYGLKKFEIDNKNKSLKLEKMIERYGEKEGYIKYNNWKKSSRITLEVMQNKYGKEKGIKKYNNYIIKKKKYFTRSWFIEKHGEIEGFKKYTERYNKMWNQSSYSKICLKFIMEIFEKIDSKCLSEFDYATSKNGEYSLYSKDGKKEYRYDLVNKNKKICIEFNGDYWHANPLFYNDDSIMINNQSSLKIRRHDYEKIERIKSKGFDVLIVWENEYKKNKEIIIESTVNWIKEKINERE